MRKVLVFIAGLAIAAGVLILAVSAFFTEKPVENERLKAAASFYPLAHFAKKAGGPDVDVFMITPPGVESHDFEPTPRDLKRISNSDVFIYNGAGMDPWAERIAPSLKGSGVATVGMAPHFKLLSAPKGHEHEEEGHGHEERAHDPHIWLDPVLAAQQVDIIGDAFVAADPANTASYNSRADQYAGALMALDEEFSKGLAQCETRDIIVAHDAFAYLAKRYGINIIPVTGVFAGEEPSPKRIAEITRIARDRSIKYIFFEPLSSPKIARIIANETGAEVLELNPLEGLTNEQEAAGEDYISVMRENLVNLRKALGCR